MVLISDILAQGVQMLLVLLLAPLLTGFVRKVKARLVRRQGASVFQPYRDLLRLLRKEVVLAENASWLFRVTPYVTFAAIWVAAALVPTFATGLLYSWTADLIAIVALVIGLGLHRLFVDETMPLPRWLKIDDLEDLKGYLVSIVIAVLAVLFLRQAVERAGDLDLLRLAGALALMIATLVLFLAMRIRKKE